MHVRSRVLLELMSGVNIGRLHLAEQFSSMDGWQRQQDSRFDHYVQEKRSKEYFEDFDQRVERAFQAAAKAHRAELRNALKRRLRDKQDKFSASTMLEMRSAVEDRMKWLREVWAQVDADYRSNDAERQKRAAEEITAALRGEPGEYMKWVYEQARERRFLGDKGKAALDAELADAELPEVSDEEVNRYHNLKWSMTEIEHNVKSKFGVAGQQHWAELQAAKDDEYEQKLDTAAQVYQKLLDQNDRFDESRRTALLRSNVERIHQAQVRFKASMEMEANREQLVEAHRSMEEERTRIAKEQRVALLKEAAELKKSGVPNEEISLRLKERQLARQAQRQDEYRLRERESVQAKKNEYLRLIQQLRTDSEEREGRELLQPQRSEAGWQQRTHNVFGFADDDRSDVGGEMAASSGPAGHMAASHTEGDVLGMEASSSASPSTHRAIKKQLWDAIHDDKYEEPFLTVHQARLDAAKTYDPLYASHFPTSLAQGKKYSRQSMGTHAAGNEQDNEMMQKVNSNYFSYNWGVQTGTVHDLDGDGELDYLNQSTWHVRDKTTGDVDWRYERKKGGAVFRGPRFYRMGAERDAADPGERTMDPLPPPKRRLPSSAKSSSNTPLPFGRSN